MVSGWDQVEVLSRNKPQVSNERSEDTDGSRSERSKIMEGKSTIIWQTGCVEIL